MNLLTANGKTRVDRKTRMHLKVLRRKIDPLIMQSSPPVLSLGKRCMHEGFSFWWEAGHLPILYAPDGRETEPYLQNLVPMLHERTQMLMTPCPDVLTHGASPEISGRKLPPIAVVDYQHLLTHHPKLPDCEACQKAKMQAKPCRRQISVNEEWKIWILENKSPLII